MPIDRDKALGAEIAAVDASWDPDRVILYHLGIGAGVGRATDPRELAYTYEKQLRVLPSFAVVPVFGALLQVTRVPGIQINPLLVLHGEQDVALHRPIPPRAEITTTGRVAGVYDKGKAALIVLEAESREKGGSPLFTNRFGIFARGEGGFGGAPAPKPEHEAPSRAPDAVVETATTPHQPLLYRLSGDKNPLHADPEVAKLGGFDRPILHGLCSFGIVCKAVVDTALDGDVAQVARYQARFAGVVFPGETIVTSMWREPGKISIAASTKERGTPVVSHSAITLR